MPRNLNEALGQGKRFIVAADYLLSPPDYIKIAILSDFNYWADHYEELQEWATYNCATVTGSTITFEHDKDVTAFILRWS